METIAGAVQLCVDQFVSGDIEHSEFVPAGTDQIPISLSKSTAHLLDSGAEQFIRSGNSRQPLNNRAFPGGGLFAALSRIDRLQALALLDRLDLPLNSLLPPYRNNPGIIQTMIDSLTQLTMFGYYSEWFGYGTTRLYPPECRRIAFFPPGWRLSGYPGPAFGYRDLRGYILKYPHGKGGCPNG
ncbi:hypothetical protein [Paenibacillus harenae]|uniref:hypothetical protein n=1 Tax=Paenibacillus harenae TaxID=306543 RepID=UPI000409644B|nr:hypothetical protein [Paenibacillus harenae]